MKKMKLLTISKRIVLVLVAVFLGLQVYAWNAENLLGNRLPMPFGYGAAVVLSGSMEPAFSKGDLIIVQETDQFQQDDIVVFQDVEFLVVHRIVSINDETVVTKGDANKTADEPIRISDIKGKVLFWIPYAGNVVSFIKTPAGTMGMLAAAVALVEISHRSEKEKDDAEREKIIAEIERLKKEMQE